MYAQPTRLGTSLLMVYDGGQVGMFKMTSVVKVSPRVRLRWDVVVRRELLVSF